MTLHDEGAIYTVKLCVAINLYWRKYHIPPTVRELMAMTGIPSTSMIRFYVRKLPDIRITDSGKFIPNWVDELFQKEGLL